MADPLDRVFKRIESDPLDKVLGRLDEDPLDRAFKRLGGGPRSPREAELERLRAIADAQGIPEEEQRPDTGFLGRIIDVLSAIEYAEAGVAEEVIESMTPEEQQKVKLAFELLAQAGRTDDKGRLLPLGKLAGGLFFTEIVPAAARAFAREPIKLSKRVGGRVLREGGRAAGGVGELILNIRDAPGKLINAVANIPDLVIPGDAIKNQIVPEVIPDRIFTSEGEQVDFVALQEKLGVSEGIKASDVLPKGLVEKGGLVDSIANGRMRTGLTLGLLLDPLTYTGIGLIRKGGTITLSKAGAKIGLRQMTREATGVHRNIFRQALGVAEEGVEDLTKAAKEVQKPLLDELTTRGVRGTKVVEGTGLVNKTATVDDLTGRTLDEFTSLTRSRAGAAAREVADEAMSARHFAGEKVLTRVSPPRWMVDKLGEGYSLTAQVLSDSSGKQRRRIGEILIDAKDRADAIFDNFRSSIADNELYNNAFEIHQAETARILKDSEDRIAYVFEGLSADSIKRITRAFYSGQTLEDIAKRGVNGQRLSQRELQALGSSMFAMQEFFTRELRHGFASGGAFKGAARELFAQSLSGRSAASKLQALDFTGRVPDEALRLVAEGYDLNLARPIYFDNFIDDVENGLRSAASQANRVNDYVLDVGSKYGRAWAANRALGVMSPEALLAKRSLKLRPVQDIREVLRRLGVEHFEALQKEIWKGRVTSMFRLDKIGVDVGRMFRGIERSREMAQRVLGPETLAKVDAVWGKFKKFRTTRKVDPKTFRRFQDLPAEGKAEIIRRAILASKNAEDLLFVFDRFSKYEDLFPRFRTLKDRANFIQGVGGVIKVNGKEVFTTLDIAQDLSKAPLGLLKNKQFQRAIRAWDAITNFFKTMVTSAAVSPELAGAFAGGATGLVSADEDATGGDKIARAFAGALAGATGTSAMLRGGRQALVRGGARLVERQARRAGMGEQLSRVAGKVFRKKGLGARLLVPLFPAFHFRNAYGNVALGFTDVGIGIANPKRLADTLGIMANAQGEMVTELGERLPYQLLREEIKTLGIRQQGKQLFELVGDVTPFADSAFETVRGLKQRAKALRESGQKIGETIEAFGRIQLYLVNRARGEAADVAAARVQRHLFNYSALSDFEKQVMRRLVPFWTFCVPDHSEILTTDGWKTCDGLSEGDTALTYNVEKDCYEWQPVESIHIFDYDAALSVLENKRHKLEFTPEHRWVVEQRPQTVKRPYGTYEYEGKRLVRRGYELTTQDRIKMVSTLPEGGDSLLTPEHAALLGWLLTDGSFRWRGNYCEAVIYQHPKKTKCYDAAVKAAGREPTFFHPDSGVAHIQVAKERVEPLKPYLNRDKKSENWIDVVTQLSREAAEAMYDAMYLADGVTVEHRHQDNFACSIRGVKETFEVLATLLGKRVTYHERKSTRLGSLPTGNFYVSHKQHLKVAGCDRRSEHYKGRVWCPKTKNETWVMKQNGVITITGNTRKNLPLQLQTLIDKPGRLAIQAKLVRAKQRDDAPIWMSRGDRIRLSNDGETLVNLDGVDLPFTQLRMLDAFFYPYHVISGDKQKRLRTTESLRSDWVAMMHPLLKRVVELGVGREAFTGRPVNAPKTSVFLGRMVSEMPKGVQDFVGYSPKVSSRTGRVRHNFDPHKLWVLTDAFMMSRVLYSPDRLFELRAEEDIDYAKAAMKWLTGIEVEELPQDELIRRRVNERVRFLRDRLQQTGDVDVFENAVAVE